MLLNLLLSHSYLMYSFLFSYLFISYHIFFIHLIYFHYQVLHNLSGSSSFRTFQLRIFGFPKLLHDWVCASRALVCLSDKQHSSFEQCTDTVLPNLTIPSAVFTDTDLSFSSDTFNLLLWPSSTSSKIKQDPWTFFSFLCLLFFIVFWTL